MGAMPSRNLSEEEEDNEAGLEMTYLFDRLESS